MLAIMWRVASDEAVLTAAGTHPAGWVASGGFGLANLKTQDVTERARYTAIGTAPGRLVADFGRARAIQVVALVAHTGSEAGRWRWGLSQHADLSAPLVHGEAALVLPETVWGTRPWGEWRWQGTGELCRPYRIAWTALPAAAPARYLWVEIDDPAHPDGWVDIGRLMAGWVWEPADGISYGASVQVVDPSEVRMAPRGRRGVVSWAPYRVLRLSLEMSRDEALGLAHDLLWQAGVRRELLVIWDMAGREAGTDRLTLYGVLTKTEPLICGDGDIWTLTLEIQELV